MMLPQGLKCLARQMIVANGGVILRISGSMANAPSRHTIQRTHHPHAMFPHRHMQLYFRRRDVFMPQQILDAPQIRASL
jgi:hypothetical protein